MNNRVLVVAPHPDDEILGCGGTIARHTAQGDEVQVLIMTRGAPDVYPLDDEEDIRREAKAAHATLGVSKTHFLDFPAPKLDTIPGYQLADAIATIIRQYQPQIIYSPHRGDVHLDHQKVYLATLVAARPVNQCPVRQLLCYETLSETEWAPPASDTAFVPTVFINITDYLDLKLKAMHCYQSELQHTPHPRSLQAIETLAKQRGSTVSLLAAEAFMLVRQII
ncbi:MAG: PIG-L family deacetylase [Leptolyngbyaceae cyanobacterium SL_5_9]|nr:PIG-L family deacetylase [Leptolyngbyaceae cyanobacterium SL_5_9]